MAQDASVIRTAPIFTNIKNLWKSHLQLHQVCARGKRYMGGGVEWAAYAPGRVDINATLERE
eukprot:1160142-Pelagomonas_calceolata.AAC.30